MSPIIVQYLSIGQTDLGGDAKWVFPSMPGEYTDHFQTLSQESRIYKQDSLFKSNIGKYFTASETYLITPQEIATNLDYVRWLDVYGQSSQTFQVQACEEALILLAEYFGVVSDNAYSVYLGTVSNSISYIMVCILINKKTNHLFPGLNL